MVRQRDMTVLFLTARDRVSGEAVDRYRVFANECYNRLRESGRDSEWPGVRWEWLMEDPEWFEAVMLARLEGR